MLKQLTISVITINYNNAAGLSETISSVLSQTYPHIEYIIIDGGSTDESVDVIKSYELKMRYWISEPDTGVYHAMNKGIKQATGDYILFLNSGDRFQNSYSISELVKHVSGEDFIYSDLLVEEPNKTWLKTYPSVLSFSHFLNDSLPHPCTLIKTSVFKKLGCYNETFKIVADWEFFILAICKYNCSYKHLALAVSVFNYQGMSSNPANLQVMRAEKQQTFEKHFSCFVADYENFERQASLLNSLKYTFKRTLHLTYEKTKSKLIRKRLNKPHIS